MLGRIVLTRNTMWTYELDFTTSKCPINLNKETLFMKLYSIRLNTHCRFAAIQWLVSVMHAGEAVQPPPRLAFFIHWSNSPFQLPVSDYFKAVVLYLLYRYITQTEDGVLAHCSCLCSWTQSTGRPKRWIAHYLHTIAWYSPFVDKRIIIIRSRVSDVEIFVLVN